MHILRTHYTHCLLLQPKRAYTHTHTLMHTCKPTQPHTQKHTLRFCLFVHVQQLPIISPIFFFSLTKCRFSVFALPHHNNISSDPSPFKSSPHRSPLSPLTVLPKYVRALENDNYWCRCSCHGGHVLYAH